LKTEFEGIMQQMGASKVADIVPSMVIKG